MYYIVIGIISFQDVNVYLSLQLAQKAQQTKVKAPKVVSKGASSRGGQRR